jgi:hypothetical protein
MFVPSDGTALLSTPLQLPSGDRILQACLKEFKGSFNLHPFKFDHTLYRSDLFGIPRIVELAKRIIEKNDDYCALNLGHASIGTKFGFCAMDAESNAIQQNERRERLNEAVSHPGENGSWVKPVPPGPSPLRDSLKWKLMSMFEHRNPTTFSKAVHTSVNRL